MKIAFRVDASLQIGSGHVMRCLTLAEALRERGAETHFVCRELDGHLGGLIQAQGFDVCLLPVPGSRHKSLDWSAHAPWLEVHWQQDAKETIEVMQNVGPVDWLVVDHYALDMNWEIMLLVSATKVMAIDDLADRPHDCSLLLDQNFYADMPSRYEKLLPHSCVQLLGPKYALLRAEFAEAGKELHQRVGSIKRLFMFFGGADVNNETGKALKAIHRLNRSDIIVDVVVGSTNPHQFAIQEFCQKYENLRYHCQVDNMANLMVAADLAIAAGGATTWERCCLGLPTLVVATANNQLEMCLYGAEKGLFHYLGKAEHVSVDDYCVALSTFLAARENLSSFSARGRELVDGRGVQRVCNRLIHSEIVLRPAVADDCNKIYTWRNAEETRRHIFESRPIGETEHREWFARSLADPDRFIFIGEIAKQPIGVFRLDLDGEHAKVSIYMVPGRSGRGLGLRLIETGIEWVQKNLNSVKNLIADIKPENLQSLKIFSDCGFVEHHRVMKKQFKDNPFFGRGS